MRQLIGICGFSGSGKGSAGLILEQNGFIQESFAKPLKDVVAMIFNWPRVLLEGDTVEGREWREQTDSWWSHALNRPNFTPRLALQLMGTEAGREVYGHNLWTSALINRLEPDKDYVVTDVRFVNEIKAIQKAGGHVLHVVRGSYPEWFEYAQQCALGTQTSFDWHGQIIHRSEWDWVNTAMPQIFN
ncbi:MAG: hypothetical protein ACREQ5_08475, partial [Candidatus Dormibacteria bacterium]